MDKHLTEGRTINRIIKEYSYIVTPELFIVIFIYSYLYLN